MRLTFVISSLKPGGAERVMSIMANYWTQKNWTVTLLTLDDGQERPFFALHPKVIHVPLNLLGTSKNGVQAAIRNIQRLIVLRNAIKSSKPDFVLSFMDGVNVLTLLATVRLRLPVIVSERSDPAAHKIGKVWSLLRLIVYRFATALVVQSQEALSFFPPQIRRRTHIIPNPVISPPGERCTKGASKTKQVVGMGRLEEVKGFDLLMHGFARIAHCHRDWSLVIWGEGSQRSELEILRDRLGLQDRVHFPGKTRTPHEKLREGDLFVLSSRYEGFPNALSEAMACGLPVISFDCPSGPRNIIRHNVDGLLVTAGDLKALASAMDRLMCCEDERKRLSTRSSEVLERFSLEKIMAKWEKILLPLRNR